MGFVRAKKYLVGHHDRQPAVRYLQPWTGPFLVRKTLCPNSNRKCLFITCRAKMWKVDGLRHQWKHSSQSTSLSLSLLLVVWLESCWQQLQFTWWWEGMTASSFWRANGTRKLKKPRQQKRQKNNWVLWAEQQLCTCITLFSTFPSHPLHNYTLKPPDATFYRGSEHMTDTFPSLVLNLDKVLHNSTAGNITFIWQIKGV